MSMRERQIEALRSMLNLTSGGGDPTWKVLIYDKTGQNVIGPVLSVKELRELGVTLHLPLHSERDTIPEAPAVYFCLPTEENIHRICQDLNNNLYGSYYYNFISPINRQKLEDIASASLQSNTVGQIQKLFDQYVNFICLEDEMFCLKPPDDSNLSYFNLNRASVSDTEMDSVLDTITESLFSLCVTLGTVPIIRCPKGNAAEAVAEKLDKKLRDNLKDARNSLFGSDGAAAGRYSFHRPVLVLVDRAVDMATPLHHTWTYQALAHDVLPAYHQNRVKVPGGDAAGGVKKKDKDYELSSSDTFWTSHKGSPFPQVAEAIQEALEEIKAKQEDIQRMKSDLGLSENSEAEAALSGLSLSDNTAKLTTAITDLPMLLEKKRLIDMHTSLATAILDCIKKRKLDVYFELEEKIMSGTVIDKSSIIEMISDPDGTPTDKLRFFFIYFLTNTLTDVELDQFCSLLQKAGCQTTALAYMKRWKSFAMIGSKNFDFNQGQGMATTKSVSMFSKLMEKSSNFVMEGVKNLVVKKHDLPVTKIVDDMMEQKSGKYNDEYRYLDSKILRGGDSIPRIKTTFNDAIVFVVGGGNYIEYQNLTDYVKAKNAVGTVTARRVVYGCTQLCTPSGFLHDLEKLGSEM